jgi:dephospho-CoA kinase
MGKLIGLTGGIGSGKSTVAEFLADKGASIIDADRIAHEIYEPGKEGHERIIEKFGRGVLADDGTVDRRKLGEIVFEDRAQLEELNRIIHPLVRREVAERVARITEEDPERPIVIEAALMTETSWSGGAGELWAVITDPEIAVERLVRSRAMSEEEARLRMVAQTSNSERRANATRVIENDGSVEDLELEVSLAWREFMEE